MAKKSMIERDVKRSNLHNKYAKKREALKAKIMNKETSFEERFEAVSELAALPANSAKNRQRNRCAITGRPRGYHRKFGLSRNQLRELSAKGEVPGVIRSSW